MAIALCGAASAVQAAVPSPWLAQDVGSPSPAGSSSASSGTFTMTASGVDIWGTSDQFQFVYQTITGDFSITARVDSLQYTNEWAKAGVMIRNSLSSTSREVFAGVTPAPGVTFQQRPSGSSSTTSAGFLAGIGAPRWIRLTRSGTSITASTSADGSQWTTINTISLSLNSTVYVGLAVTSHSAGVLTTATLSNVSVTPGAGGGSGGGAVPSPQKAADIGSPAIAGSTSYNAGQYTIKAGGNDIWNASDQFHYVYQPLSGDGEFIARVSGLGNSNSWAKAGLMVRETLDATSRHADAMITPGNGFTFQRRIDTSGTTVSTTGFPGTAPVWVRLVRTGYKFDAYRSTDGQTWSPIGSDTVPMTDPVYVGLAVTSHNTSVGTTAVLDNVSIKAGSGPNNQPPTVTLTSPTPGASFTAPATISLSANASDPENRMSHVDFYAGTTLLTSVSTSPYSYTWSSVPAGTYSLTAVATDADGGKTTSAPVSVTVGGGQSSDTQAPTAPAGLTASATSSTQVNLSWTASTDNVGVTGYRIERCQGSGCTTFAQIGTSTATSYSATGLSASTAYGFRVSATDAAGNLSGYSNAASATTQGQSSAGISFVQVNSAVPQSATTSATVAFNAAQTAGGLNVVVVGWNDATAQVQSVSDSAGNVYALAVGPTVNTSGPASQAIYYAKNIRAAAAGGNTVSVQFDQAAQYPDIRIAEYKGADTTNPLDVQAGAQGNNATTSSGAVTTTSANDLIVGANMTTVGNTTGPGASFTSRVITSPDSDMLEDRIAAATGSYAADAPLSASGPWIMQIVAFRPAGSSSTADTQAPTAPSSVTATAASSNQINLTWTASTDNVGVASYVVERCQGSGCTTFTQTGTSATTSYSVTGLSASTSYSFRVRALDAAGNQSASSPVATASTTATADTQAPTAPTSLTASAISGTQVNLTWTASSDNVGVTGYVVERCQGSGCTTFTQVGTPTAASFNDTTGLTAGTTYSYRVRAKDGAGNTGPYSSVANATTQSASTAPTTVTFTASTDDNTSLVTGYRLEVFAAGANPSSATPVATSDLGKPTPDSTSTITVDRASFFNGLAAGSYVATVSAYGSGGSSRSTAVTFTR